MQNLAVSAIDENAPTIHLAMAEVGGAAALRVINQWSSGADAASIQRPDRLLARALLRGLLEGSSPRTSDRWQITKAPNGKPLVTGCDVGKLPSISISHSGSWVACAVSIDGDVGIDIERMRCDRDIIGIAARAFGPSECAEVATEGCSKFYAIWTLREAIAKAVGIGLEMAVDGRDRVQGGKPDSFRRLWIDGEPWQVVQRELSSGLSFALALRGMTKAALPRLQWWLEEP